MFYGFRDGKKRNKMSNDNAKTTAVALKEWNSYLTSNEVLENIASQIAANVNPNHLAKVVFGAMSRNPGLLDCTKSSIMFCLGECARLGLEPALGRVWFIPFKNKNKQVTECTMIIGYTGLCDLARRSGNVLSIESHVVYEGDEFEVLLGTECRVHHKPLLSRGTVRFKEETKDGKYGPYTVRTPYYDGEKAGDPIYVYCVAKFAGGGHHYEGMSFEEIEKIRERSKAGTDGPWITDYLEMAKKTVIRRAAKMWPLSIMDHSFTEAMHHNDEVEFDFSVNEQEQAEPRKTTAEVVAEKMKALKAAKQETTKESAESETIDEEVSVFEQAKRKIENAKTKAELDAVSKWYLPLCSSGTGEIIMDEEEELVRLFNEKFGQLKK